MTLQVEMDAVQANLPDMLAAAKNGDEVLIVENAHPVAKLIAVKEAPDKIASRNPEKGLGSWAGQIHMADDFDAPLDEFNEPFLLNPAKPYRTPGSMKGLLEIGDDFEAPLDDFKDYM